MVPRKPKHIAEFGDFQTPDHLAKRVITLLKQLGVSPRSVIEPSCGRGAFLVAAAEAFPRAALFGLDVNEAYLSDTRGRLPHHQNLTLKHESFFRHDWDKEIEAIASPILLLGNPPWVTNAELGAIGSENLPAKSNFQNMKGLEALTGKSNFDISEWMLLKNIEWLRKKPGTLAVLCKTAVARKVISAIWKRNTIISDARIYRIDALKNFGAAVDACLFFIQIDGITHTSECKIYDSLDSHLESSRIAFVDRAIISNIELYMKYRELVGLNRSYTWRSGVKHDCAKIMELSKTSDGIFNGLGQHVDIEDTYLYPLVKSSDIAGSKQINRQKLVIITQRNIGDNTHQIEREAPRTWAYLQKHRLALNGRTSVIYRNKPAFSIFGVGDYTFSPWKIAISGLYKRLVFRIYSSEDGKPICFDDTVYFLPFETLPEAQSVIEMLNSDAAQGLLESMVFWDEKRPITVELLKRVDIGKIANHLGRAHELSISRPLTDRRKAPAVSQTSLFG
jgi:methylase of polypeptide subunit release factors